MQMYTNQAFFPSHGGPQPGCMGNPWGRHRGGGGCAHIAALALTVSAAAVSLVLSVAWSVALPSSPSTDSAPGSEFLS